MDYDSTKNAGRNQIKPLFRALNACKRAVWCGRTGGTYILASLLLIATLLGQGGVPAAAARPDIPFGRQQTLNLFPGAVETTEWAGVEHVLAPDLGEDALYQDFSARTSAYVPQGDVIIGDAVVSSPEPTSADAAPSVEEVAPDEPASTTAPTPSVSPSSADTASGDATNTTPLSTSDSAPEVTDNGVATPVTEVAPEPGLEPEPEQQPTSPPTPEPTPVDEPAAEDVPTEPGISEDESVSLLERSSGYVRDVFALVTGVFPFAQETVEEVVEEAAEAPAPEPPATSVDEPAPTTDAPTLSETGEGGASAGADDAAATNPTPAPEDVLAPPSPVVLSATSTPTPETEASTPQVLGERATSTEDVEDTGGTADAAADRSTTTGTTSSLLPAPMPAAEAQDEAVDSSVLAPAAEGVLSLRLDDFSAPALESGQFVTGMQLRLSFAAQLTEPVADDAPSPYVEVLFGPPDALEPVGTILITDEVSNALNGGYFLFALPATRDLTGLASTTVVIRYVGDRTQLDGMYLDAAWLEVDTKVVTRDDLRARGKAAALAHLGQPTLYALVSDQLNFRRDESPVFNLRYQSQRNFIVRNVRSLLGRDLVRVEAVTLTHQSQGPSGVEAEVVTTAEGLTTISIPEAERAKLRPGQYTVEVTVDEGGKTFTDSFDFQWGILSLNPTQSTYTVGDEATLSIGALTPSGHTICEAALTLYVTDPDGYIAAVPVAPSGQCDGNNVTDVPDFTAAFGVTATGTYELYLERVDEAGAVLSFTTDSFLVDAAPALTIERVGPSRIYPPAPYPMALTVAAAADFTGTLTERVPASFEVFDTDANVSRVGEWQELTWALDLRAGESATVRYNFDAPDLSPFLYELGPAQLAGEAVGALRAGTTTATGSAPAAALAFTEHRQWQIASDAVGNMILFWDDGATIPAGWTCLSCGSGTFFQRFVMGSSTYNTTGGAATHGHTAVGSILASSDAATESGGGTVAPAGHSHSYTPTISTESNLPAYRQLRVIQYTAAAGEPATIPAGAIGIFDTTSLPAGWSQYSAQNGRYVYGEDTPGTTGGSNTHSHAISGSTGASTGAGTRVRGGDTVLAANDTHTHTVSGATPSYNHEPPYIEVVLGQLSADAAPPNGLIAMWTEDVDGGWIDVSSAPGDPFSERFIKPAATYGATGGGSAHAHADVTGLTTSAAIGTITNVRSGVAGAPASHTHTANVTGFSTAAQLPPYLTAVFGKRQGTDPVYEQLSSRWYTNTNAQTPTDPWPAGATLDLLEREAIAASSEPVALGDIVRLRLNVGVSNATSTSGAAFTLQYASTTLACSAATGWSDVGDLGSGAEWRGYDNGSVADASTLSTTLLASTTVAETYEERGFATSSPNDIVVDEVGEWDFVLEQNGAAPGATYCFRLVEADGSSFLSYSHYPTLLTNRAPAAPTLDGLFDSEMTASTSPFFTFVSSDPEGETIHYAVEVDDDPTFASPTIARDTLDDASLFENQVVTADKTPFQSGDLIEFRPTTALTNGATYYWRVRAQDPEGSGAWGDWSTVRSFTIDTSLTASAWFQTEDEQFETGTLAGTATGGDEVELATGSTTGSLVSAPIDFADGSAGTAWGSLAFSDTETAGDLSYQVEYYDGETWATIPDGDLAGNSGGFDASPVSLLGLDVDTYGTIRLRSTFSDVGGTPSLQDWAVYWGYRVETPIITKLFANEQVGTTTPTFEFMTSDPQNDSLTYQIEWALTPDFTSATTRTSDTDAGFVNVDAGADTDPFASGDSIQFTIAGADALADATTYWWRVRAKDTTGDDAYSFWTEPQSFTVVAGTDVSTWYQTTEEQFDTNILSGTVALPADSVSVATTASEAMLVYGEGTETSPRYRLWDGTSWSAEGEMQDVSAPIKWSVVRAATTREEYVAATQGTDNDVNVQVFSTGAWGSLQELTTGVANVNARGFDVTYETTSGDALVVYCDGDDDPSYVTWDGAAWSSPSTIATASANDCAWVELAADPTSNEVIAVIRDTTGSQYEGWVWDGATWGNNTSLGTARNASYSGISVAYEASGNQAVVAVPSPGGGPNRMVYATWNGTTWSGVTTQTISGRLYWAELAPNVGSDEMVLCYQGDGGGTQAIRWDGGAFTGDTQFTATAYANTDPGFACTYETTPGRSGYILGVYADPTATYYRSWNTAAWSGATQVNAIGPAATMQLVRTGVGTILGSFYDAVNESLRFATWDGSSWSSTQTLETNLSIDSSPFGRPYAIAPRNSGSEGTTIVSPGVNFTDGVGPYWDEFTWTDTTPGASQITYQLQYQTATGSWAFVPESALPGNSTGLTSPVDLSSLSISTYDTLRPYASLSCDGGGNCPEVLDWRITWAGGITISGTLQQYDETTNVTAGTVAVAVDGVLQTGKVGSVSVGTWSIDNVTVFPGDIVTVFLQGASDASEAVGVTRYDGTGDITGISLYERHLSLGSDDATSTPLTNVDVGSYTVVNTEDVFLDLQSTTLDACGTIGCGDVVLSIKAGTTYAPGGIVRTHDLKNDGTLSAPGQTLEVSGSWDNNATTSLAGGTVAFTAIVGTETVDATGASVASFGNVTFGTTSSSATWTLASPLDVDGALTVSHGTLDRGATPITVAGSLATDANGQWSGVGTTTFDGVGAATWRDDGATLQNVGNVVIDGAAKVVTLAGDVAANRIHIGANDTLDASTSNYGITVYADWVNQNNFLARAGTVTFAAPSGSYPITSAGDAFHHLQFTGATGAWAFTENAVTVGGDLTVSGGTVTLPTGTTTVAGSFDATGGSFAHNNGTLLFTSGGAETLTFDGGAFTNVAHTLTFNGAGSWTLTDVNATSTNDVRITQGAVTFPSGTLAIGGALTDVGGSFAGGGGTVRFYGSSSETLTAGGSTFDSVRFDGPGSWSFSDTNLTVAGDLSVAAGSLTLPTGTLNLGGSYTNAATVDANAGTLAFTSDDSGETVNLGSSPLADVTFSSPTGGWTLTAPATTTGALSLSAAGDWTLAAGQTLAVGGAFTNLVGGASTTWTGSTLSLEAGSYSINGKGDAGDTYGTLRVKPGVAAAFWNSSAVSYAVAAGASLYSQDHGAVDGALYVFGDYTRASGTEYWDYARDFDGADLSGGNERPAQVRFDAGASASFTNATLSVTGAPAATTTVANQGSGTYAVAVTGGTTTARYFDLADLGGAGLALLGGTAVPTFSDGSLTVGAAGGSALTLASTTIDANPAAQRFNIRFATSTAGGATNVTQTDGVPSSFWWFRDGSGGLYGEAFDNDTGDPGSVRFDDSSLVITVAGTVYADAGVTPLGGPTCDDVTPVVRVVVAGAASYTGSCASADGSFSIGGVTVIGDPTLTVYLNDAPGGERASAITRTPTGDLLDFDLYQHRVITRHEGSEPLTTENLATYDQSDDADLVFAAATSTGADTLTLQAGNELYVFASTTFAPGGPVTLNADAAATDYNGSLVLGPGATFEAFATSTVTVGGRLALSAGASFSPASSTVQMTATTTGKAIAAPGEVTLYDLVFAGAGGGWNLTADVRALGDVTIEDGTVTGTGDLTLPSGSLTGDGVLSLGGGTTTLAASNTLGGASAWTFYNLTLGSGVAVGTTTVVAAATTTVGGQLTIADAHFLDAGATTWDLAGVGSVFVEDGTFLEGASTVRYSGAGAVVTPTTYYDLDINAGAGSPTYTAAGPGLLILGDLTIGGEAASSLDLAANDPVVEVDGNLTIAGNGTLLASDVAALTLGGSYANAGTFTGNGGTITLDGTGAVTIDAGTSPLANLTIDGTGNFTVVTPATTTGALTLTDHGSFTVASGQSLAVGGGFWNGVGGAATTWTGSTLALFGGGTTLINAATTTDSYGTLWVGAGTQVRTWNSDATSYAIDATGSLYSQDHSGVDGDLAIWGAFAKTSGSDYWDYARDFDGTPLTGGAERAVNVAFAPGAAASISGGSLSVVGVPGATTTISSQGGGDYALTVGGAASTTFRYYALRDLDGDGLTLTGSPAVADLSFGDIAVSVSGGSALTVGGSVISANPAKTFTGNRFALDGVGSATNVTATGTAASSWRFTNHTGDLDGEAFDVDPDGDPGYVAWDDSAALITVSGRVYSDEGTTVLPACDGATPFVTLRVAGLTSYTASCDDVTGAYSITNVAYSPGDSLVVYLDGIAPNAAAVTEDPISNINGLDLYQNRVILRHEGTDPLAIADLAVWDSSDDADLPFTAVNASPDTLTLPADTKLIVWAGKEFAPAGDVTVSGGGGGAAFDGTLELQAGATWTGQGSEALAVGGSFLTGSGATFVAAAAGTTTFTTNESGRIVDVNGGTFGSLAFTGTGSWTVSGATLTTLGDLTIAAGALTLPSGTTTIAGSFVNGGGSFDANGGALTLTGGGSHTLTLGGSPLAQLVLDAAGAYSMGDVAATTTDAVIIEAGALTLPSGTLAVGGDFDNRGGTLAHSGGEVRLTSDSGALLRTSGADLAAVTVAGSGSFTMADQHLTLLDTLTITGGDLALATGTLTIGGSFTAPGGTFAHGSGTVLFNSSDGGETIDPGTSDFYNVQIGAPAGGYTLTGSATTTNHFTLASAASFTVAPGTTLTVGGVFQNLVGGSATTWSGSTLILDGENAYTLNTKAAGGDQYDALVVTAGSALRAWNSAAMTTTVDASSSFYSQDHAAVDGSLYIYGDFRIATTSEYWDYARDFDGAALSGGSERWVIVEHAAGAATTLESGALSMVGALGSETTVTTQAGGSYHFAVTGGTFTANRYAFRNLDASGLILAATPTITTLDYGDFELAAPGGALVSLSSTTLNTNASLIITGTRFATTTAITGSNVTLDGETSSAWTFVGHSGNLDGEAYDNDGATACGQVRWDDSSCLLTQQTHYRWRHDDGGLGAPTSEWFNENWSARQRVRLENADVAPYADAAVKLTVPYDSDMRTDFADLRFTDASGTTTVPFWIASTTPSVAAEVWVKVSGLPAEGTATVFMYYGNAVATAAGSITDTFTAGDDFEDSDLNEYSGQTSEFSVDTTQAYDGSYGLTADGNEMGRTNLGGIARFDETVSQGETIRFAKYIDAVAGTGDEVCTTFGVQSPVTASQNYAVCFNQDGLDQVKLSKDVTDDDDSGTTLAATNVTYTTGWYVAEVAWGTDDSLALSLYDPSGALVATASATDSSYTSGGYGFTFWFHYGAWDSFTSRPTLASEPSVRFGAKQGDGGASWAAALDTPTQAVVGETARLRLAIENSGLAITDQTFQLEYAPQGAAPSCEAVTPASFVAVPPQASCGTSPVCMQASGNVTNGAPTTDLLFGTEGAFTAGEAREDPSNTTAALDVGQDAYTELEYVLSPTANVVDQNLCFRVTDAGADYDTYLRVAKLSLRFDPTVGAVTFNDGTDIALTPGTTTRVFASTTVTDLNGYTDLVAATSTFYTSAAGAACTPDNNDCYVSTTAGQCSFSACAGNACALTCYADVYFHADPTDEDGGLEWFAFLEAEDAQAGYDFGTSIGVDLLTLRALEVDETIDYGALPVASDTGSSNASTSIRNLGNTPIDVEVEGTDLSDGGSSVIPADQQKFATSTFTYAACATCAEVSSTSPVTLEVDLSKPTADNPPVADEVYWGIAVPFGVNSAPHFGTNTFYAVSDS